MEYNFRELEKKWQQYWNETNAYKVSNEDARPKYYVLDMFPYPSGAGLHVGHPLGYIASDIFARYKRLKGFNVLHPMGYDAFGLPAEQYALDHGIHPAVSTAANIKNFRSQLDKIGFCYDWSREVNTSQPDYYKWTQWLFIKLYNSYFCNTCKQAKPISELIAKYEKKGSSKFTAAEWNNFSEATKEEWLMKRRLVYSAYGDVNWCEALGTVLANDEVVNGVSERGGHPVEKRKMRQWFLRITAYADRLLEGLNKVDFSEAMKEMQTNWIGKSSGAEINFKIKSGNSRLESLKASHKGGGLEGAELRVYTTRPDTIFGVDFMVLAPEHELINEIKSAEQAAVVDEYVAHVKSRSERERMSEKKISGVFTGAYAINPFDGREIPVWTSEYVLAGYGTGAIMAVPCGDERDHKFAKHFNIPVTNIIGSHYNGEEANPTKDAVLENSGFLNGLVMKEAIEVAINKIEAEGIGKRKVNYKMRDAGFSRQRYWGEPFPIVWKEGVPAVLDEKELPLLLPHLDVIKPGALGEGPLANLTEWVSAPELNGGKREVNTMPGYAGSSWYFLRYMDPENKETFCSRKASDYWGQVDLYVGGTEHAVGHLLYSRMWTKVLYDLGLIGFDEPFKRLLNQGMIQGSSRFVYRIHGTNTFVSHSLLKNEEEYNGKQLDKLHVDVNIVDGLELDTEAFQQWRNKEHAGAEFILDEGKYICGVETEKMSKSKFNTVNPDDLVYKYGADTFRMYEMFLGPVEMSKPWDSKGIEGVHRFLKKLWRLFYKETNPAAPESTAQVIWTKEPATPAELKILHKTIKKIEEDTERFSFNTCVSTFMICVNELSDIKCHKLEILEPLVVLLAPYAPHIAAELYTVIQEAQGDAGVRSVLNASFPKWEDKYIKESTKDYPVAINGKTRTELTLPLDISQQEVESLVLNNAIVQKWLEGKSPKKIIYVKNKMINVVI